MPSLGAGKVWSKAVLFSSWFLILANVCGVGFEDANIYIWGVFGKYVIAGGEGVLGTMEIFRPS